MRNVLIVLLIFIGSPSSANTPNKADISIDTVAYVDLSTSLKQGIQNSLKAALAVYIVNQKNAEYPQFDEDLTLAERDGKCLKISSLKNSYNCVLFVRSDVYNGIENTFFSVTALDGKISATVLSFEAGNNLE